MHYVIGKLLCKLCCVESYLSKDNVRIAYLQTRCMFFGQIDEHVTTSWKWYWCIQKLISGNVHSYILTTNNNNKMKNGFIAFLSDSEVASQYRLSTNDKWLAVWKILKWNQQDLYQHVRVPDISLLKIFDANGEWIFDSNKRCERLSILRSLPHSRLQNRCCYTYFLCRWCCSLEQGHFCWIWKGRFFWRCRRGRHLARQGRDAPREGTISKWSLRREGGWHVVARS